MSYALLSLDHADLLGEFASREEALAALDRVIAGDPAAADEVGVMAFDKKGMPVGEPIRRSITR